jgi:hypothetical protein
VHWVSLIWKLLCLSPPFPVVCKTIFCARSSPTSTFWHERLIQNSSGGAHKAAQTWRPGRGTPRILLKFVTRPPPLPGLDDHLTEGSPPRGLAVTLTVTIRGFRLSNRGGRKGGVPWQIIETTGLISHQTLLVWRVCLRKASRFVAERGGYDADVLLRLCEVLGSNLGCFPDFPQCTQADAGMLFLLRPSRFVPNPLQSIVRRHRAIRQGKYMILSERTTSGQTFPN